MYPDMLLIHEIQLENWIYYQIFIIILIFFLIV